jgi:hypothetical protein
MRKLAEMFVLWWEYNVTNLCYKNNDIALLVLSADIVSVDDDFLTKLKLAYSSCPYFSDEIKARWKSCGLVKSSIALYTYDRLVIPRPAQDLRILLHTEYHDNVGHPNWGRLLANLLKRFWWERMSFDCKSTAEIVLFAIVRNPDVKIRLLCLPSLCLNIRGKLLA